MSRQEFMSYCAYVDARVGRSDPLDRRAKRPTRRSVDSYAERTGTVKRLFAQGGIAVLLGATPFVAVGGPAEARSGSGDLLSGGPAAVTVVADHLNNPRQLAVRGNSVYVAEAGTGGSCAPG